MPASSLIEAFKAAFETQFPSITGGLLTEELPRNAPMPNCALVGFTQEPPRSAEDPQYTLTLSVRAAAASVAWGLGQQIIAWVTNNPPPQTFRARLAWSANGTSEIEAGQLAYPAELHRERVRSNEGGWIWRCDCQFEFYSLIQ